MAQTLLPFQYEVDPTNSKFTALGGLPLFLDLMTSEIVGVSGAGEVP